MKKKLSFLLAALVVCVTVTFAQNKETRNVGSFSKIAFRVPGHLYLKQGSSSKVEVQGSKELLSRLVTEVQGSRLVIHTPDKWNWKGNDEFTVYVTLPKLEELNVSGSGEAVGEGRFTMGDLDLAVSGSGSLELEIEASGELKADVSGSGSLNVKGSSRSIVSHVSGSGRVRADLNMSGTAEFSISGSGKIEASGKANQLEASISGSGKVLSSNLDVNRANIHISGSGDVETSVKDELDARISGSGNVRYKGSPDKVNVNSSGSGGAQKM